MAKSRKPRLGRGLSSLVGMPEVPVDPSQASPEDAIGKVPASEADPDTSTPSPAEAPGSADGQPPAAPAGGLEWVAVDAVTPNRFQPRRQFEEEALAQLAASIEREGLMQPIILRPLPDDVGRYELVAGERRWRAAQKAGLQRVPALLRELNDQQLAEWAVIENLQREDLNPIERAEAFGRLIDEFALSHDQVAERVGVGRPTVSNTLRLMELPPDVQQMVRVNELSGGAARALLRLEDPQAMLNTARRAVAGGWSVRMIEAAVRRASEGDEDASAPAAPASRSPVLADLEEQLASQLQTKVKIKRGRRKGSGTLQIDFYDLDQFDALLQRLDVTLEQ